MDQYTYRAEWSPESEEYVGMCLEFPSRYSRAPTAHEAIEGIERVVADEIADMVTCGAKPPPSLTNRHYSGNFMVRTSAALHARLMVESGRAGCFVEPVGGSETSRQAVDDSRRSVLVTAATSVPATGHHVNPKLDIDGDIDITSAIAFSTRVMTQVGC
jgi:predicted HicB family RNase H-like nuclease